MGRSRRPGLIPVVVVLALLVAVLGAWAIDASRSNGRVARNVTIAGRDVGGQTTQELSASVNRLAAAYEPAAVTIRTPAGTLDTTAAAVGLRLDTDATAAAARDVDAGVPAVMRPIEWIGSLFGNDDVPLVFDVDPVTLRTGTATLAAANRTEPVEPGIAPDEQGLRVVAGVPGRALDQAELARRLASAAASGRTPIVVDLEPTPVPPRFTDAQAEQLVQRANQLTRNPLTLSVAGKTATLQASTVRRWLRAAPGASALELTVDQAAVQADLEPLIADLGVAPVDASFTVAEGPNGQPGPVTIVDGRDGARCCATDSVSRILQALDAGQPTVALDLVPVPPVRGRAWAEGLAIVEPIGSFTTPHPAGQPRVVNIHRIADLARGMVIEPGATFSVNERIGQRTAEKGFVDAGVIYEGRHTTDIGGGVSQFATTLFNAAFFGGLDLVDYQSHSEFIDRYPYGREATISWPRPDLKIRNNTPHGVLIWTSYTDTSVTVTLYSTRYVAGEQTAQTTEPGDPCKKILTERTRTWIDGRQEKDTIEAWYANEVDAGTTCWEGR